MGKVKLTREQAEELELQKRELDTSDIVIRRIISRRNNKTFKSIGIDDLIKALYIGYEVEETFEVGEWVISKKDKNGIAGQITEFEYDRHWEDDFAWYGINKMYRARLSNLRHATPEEIAEEKQRRWWAKHGREVWELREDDILEYLNDLYIVDCFDSEKVFLKSGVERKTNYAEPFDFVKKHFKVVCFAENRLDL